MTAPRECLVEMKTRDREKLTVNLLSSNVPVAVLPCENYGTLKKLLRVTACVLKFANVIKKCKDRESSTSSRADHILKAKDVNLALTYWLKVSQSSMPEMKNFQLWSKQFGLFQDGSDLWRCGGRLDNSSISQAAKHPILLSKKHHLTLLIVRVS